MAAFVLTNVNVLIDEHDFTAQTLGVSTEAQANMVRVTNMASGGFEQYTPGLAQSASLGVEGYADYTDSDAIGNQLTHADIGAVKVMSVMPIGTATAGDPAIFHRGYLNALTIPTGSVGNAAMLSANVTAAGAYVVDGKVAVPLASRSGNLTGSVLAMTGPTAGRRLYAALHVTAATGTNLAVTVASDNGVGFSSPTTRITFSTTSAVGVQWSSVAGDLSAETHWRVSATATGAFTYAVLIGVA